MQRQVVGLAPCLAGLEVDHHEPPLVVALEPVDAAGEQRVAEQRLRTSRSMPTSSSPSARLPRNHAAARRGCGWPARARCARASGRRSRARPSARRASPRARPGSRPPGASARDLVHERAERGPDRVAVARAEVLQQRAQLAAQEGVDARRADRHRPIRVDRRPVVGHRRQPPPLVRVGAAHAGRGQPGEFAGGGLRGRPVGSPDRRRPRAARRPARTGACPRMGAASGRSPSIGSSSSRKRDGCSSSPLTAVTTSRSPGAGGRHVEQPPLLGQLRPGQRRTGVSRPATTSTSCSDPSNEPRRRRSGQLPSWTCATHTRSHSRPLLACAVRIVTAVGRVAAGGQRVAGDLLRREVLGEPGAATRPAAGRCSGRPRRTAARPRRGRGRPPRRPAPPAALACCQRARQPGGVPHRPQHVLGAGRRPVTAAPGREHAGDPRTTGRRTCSGSTARPARSSRAGASSTGSSGPVRTRSTRRSRRR